MRRFLRGVLQQSPARRRAVLLLLDTGLVALALLLSMGVYWALAGAWPMAEAPRPGFVAALGLGLMGLWLGGFYRPLLHRYDSRLSQLALRPVILASLGQLATVAVTGPPLALLTTPMYWASLYVLAILSRLVITQLLEIALAPPRRRQRKLAIYGAGAAGSQIARAITGGNENRLVCMADDNVDLHGRLLHGVPVVDPEHLVAQVREGAIDVVVIAIPSASRRQRRRIIETLADLPVSVYAAPSLSELATGQRQITELREITPEDLLGREPSEPNTRLLREEIAGRVVLVTGAGGSIGHMLSEFACRYKPRRVVLMASSEPALYAVDNHLREILAGDPEAPEIVSYLGSVTNSRDLDLAIGDYGAEILYHAAAYKHVPLIESNPIAGAYNNVVGSSMALQAAQFHGMDKFVLVSTDKAVRPTSVMGATKRMAELAAQALAFAAPASQPGPKVAIVRFGNVLDSAGSVVPLFRRQIAGGGPVTVTHPDIVRFFMTIPEAAQLVLQAGALVERSGEIFHLDMGQPVRIADLARRVIHLSGHRVQGEDPGATGDSDRDIEITFTGLRPGEKLYEELLVGGDTKATRHPRIYKAIEAVHPEWPELQPYLDRLTTRVNDADPDGIREILQEVLEAFDGQSLLAQGDSGPGETQPSAPARAS